MIHTDPLQSGLDQLDRIGTDKLNADITKYQQLLNKTRTDRELSEAHAFGG
jgi:hypothetical protein